MNKMYLPTQNPIDWKPFLANPGHWEKGHSAMALAACWQESNGFPTTVLKVFRDSNISLFLNIEMLAAFPEHKVKLPGGTRASQNDIFVIAKGAGQLISIMVEGKVSEDFKEPVNDWLIDASAGKRKRLDFLCDKLGLSQDKVNEIRYQLLHRTASAIIEAEKFNAPNAMILIHSFSQTKKWFEDYEKFASLFGITANLNCIHNAGRVNNTNLFLAWIKGDKIYLDVDLSDSTSLTK